MMERAPSQDVWGWTGPVRVVAALGALAILVPLVLFAPPAAPLLRPIPTLRVDPNTAPEGVLLALPSLGRARVAAIVQARQQGPFRSADDLRRRVRGIGPATITALEPYLRFPAPTETP